MESSHTLYKAEAQHCLGSNNKHELIGEEGVINQKLGDSQWWDQSGGFAGGKTYVNGVYDANGSEVAMTVDPCAQTRAILFAGSPATYFLEMKRTKCKHWVWSRAFENAIGGAAGAAFCAREVDFYIGAKKSDDFGYASVWDTNGDPVIEGAFSKFDTQTLAANQTECVSAWLGDVTNRPAWCDEPVIGLDLFATWRGWRMANIDAWNPYRTIVRYNVTNGFKYQ